MVISSNLFAARIGSGGETHSQHTPMINSATESRLVGTACPLVVVQDAETDNSRCVNGLHIETFIPNPFCDSKGTIITFASGDRVTVSDDFEDVFRILSGTRPDG
jgi:hypothetical protein